MTRATDHSNESFSPQTTLLAVMSYNRGVYLRNCMQSIDRHLPKCKAIVFDDHSTNPETQTALSDLAGKFEVIDCRSVAAGDRGGLHPNMNRAIDLAIQRGFRHILFLQDDMQIVRDADSDFCENVNVIFNADPRIAQVAVTFYKGYWPKQVMQRRIGIDREHGYYFHQPVEGWTRGIADCGVISLARIEAKGFRFEETEAGSIVKSQDLELHRADCRDPIMMFTPWPGTTRRAAVEGYSPKRLARNALIKLQEYGAGAGCHPFLPMSESAIARLKNRPLDHYPIAEDFLETRSNLRQPWWYSACNNLSDFKSVRSLLSFRWFTHGPSNYRANVRLKQRSDAVAEFGALASQQVYED